MMGVMSVAFDKWYKHYKIEGAHNLKCLISVNTRPMPQKLEDVKLNNEMIAVKFEFPIVAELEAAITEAKTKFRSDMNLFTLFSISKATDLIPYLPEFMGRIIIKSFYKDVHMLYSNVPVSEEPWYICNKATNKIGSFAHTQHDWRLFMVCSTYRGELRLTCTANEKLKMDPQILIDFTNDILLEEVKKYGSVNIQGSKED
jgi:hypothetical protein